VTDFIDQLSIDIFSLEEECAAQPQKFMKVAEQYAEAILEKEMAKRNVKVVTARTALSIRQSDPEDYGLTKWTEASIQAVIDKHPDILAAEESYFQTIRNLELLKAGKEAYMDRRSQLTNLVSLRNAQYYADPTKEAERRETRARQIQEDMLESELGQ
jgi:hypothetical protein